MKHGEPAKMLTADDCTFVSTEVFLPVNGWKVADRRRSTVVCAGSAGTEEQSTGRFVILRTNDIQGTQDLNKVDLPGSGSLRIINAPLGPNVETASQRGALEFRGTNGATGTLDLSDDTVVLNG